MNWKTNLIFALAAGLLGGLISRYVNPIPAYAQTPAAPKEIRAQSFVLVNEQSRPCGLIGFDPQGNPIIKLLDERGHLLWDTQTRPSPPIVR